MEIGFQNSHWPDTKSSGFHIKAFRILMSQIKKKDINQFIKVAENEFRSQYA